MTIYHGIGLLLSVLCGGCLLAFLAVLWSIHSKTPLYRKRMPKKPYPKEFHEAVRQAYNAAGNIRGMLLLLEGKWRLNPAGKRIVAALDYLEHSRYKDYETALYTYLSDGTEECRALLAEILEKEIRKQKRLLCKR